MVEQRADALIITASSFFFSRRPELASVYGEGSQRAK
jgi:hypothetical protein